jgi:hypothetical protein
MLRFPKEREKRENMAEKRENMVGWRGPGHLRYLWPGQGVVCLARSCCWLHQVLWCQHVYLSAVVGKPWLLDLALSTLPVPTHTSSCARHPPPTPTRWVPPGLPACLRMVSIVFTDCVAFAPCQSDEEGEFDGKCAAPAQRVGHGRVRPAAPDRSKQPEREPAKEVTAEAVKQADAAPTPAPSDAPVRSW